MDGLTVVLTVNAPVNPGVTNHIKLAIADGGDSSFDSNVFIEGGSFVSNDPPVAVNDSYSTSEDTPLTVSAPGVLGNDSDPNGNPITAIISSGPSHGTLSLNTNGSFTYSPAANYFGPDSFTYKAKDSLGALSPVATVSISVTAVDDPPVLTVNDTSNYVENAVPVVVAPNLTLTDVDGPNLTGATVSLSTNFNSAQDSLQFTNQNGITGSYNAGTGVLTLSGSASAATYQTALRSITYSNNSQNPNTAPRSVLFSIGSSLANPVNGHFYEFVTDPGRTWQYAQAQAAARSLFGLQGYLATVTSASENAFIASKLQGNGWMGATDEVAEGVWRWATGPEAGQQFWQGLSNGSTVGGMYANWAGGEPNNCCGNEDYANFLSNGQWNDFFTTNTNTAGYVVEYGGMPGDPTLQLTDTAIVNVVSVNDAPAGANKTLTTNEDATLTIVAADFGFSDVAEGHAFDRVEITTLPAAGTLKLSGAAVSAGAFVTKAQLDANQLTFDPVANASGTPYATFTFRVEDNGGTADGGVNLDPSPNTITINVIPAAVYDFSLATYATNEGNVTNTVNLVTVTRTANTTGATSVQVVVASGATNGATAGTDFTAGTFTVSFNNGESSKSVPIQLLGETTVELNETVALSLSNPSGNGNIGTTRPMATLTITNDDTATVSIGNASITEGGNLVFNVSLTNTVDVDTVITYSTANGTATTTDSDYTGQAAQTLIIPAGQTSRTITIVTTADNKVELDESLSVNLTSVTATGRDVTFLDGTGAGAIVNDDKASLIIDDVSQVEGDVPGTTQLTFTVSIDPAGSGTTASQDITVVANTSGVSATGGGVDFTDLLNQTVTIAAGSSSTTVVVNVKTENLAELDETLTLNLSDARFNGEVDATRVVIGDSAGTGTIQNDDYVPVANAGGPYVINEGSSLTLNASASSDADVPADTLTYRWDVDGDGDYDENVTGVNPTLTLTQLLALGLADGPDGNDVTVEASDGTNSHMATTTLTINNVTPTLTLNPVTSINENGVATLTGTIADPGTLDTFVLNVNWGDPLSPNDVETYTFGASAAGSQTFSLTHQYLDDNGSGTSQDTYKIKATISDDDGGAAVSGGNATINRSELDTYSNFSILDKNNPIDTTGVVNQWQIYAGDTTPIRLLIYRQSGPSYTLIAKSPLVTPAALGVNSFTLASPIPVQAGDFVGYYTQNYGVVPFNYGDSGEFVFSSNGAGDPVVGASLAIAGTGFRTYSISVSYTSTETESVLVNNVAPSVVLSQPAAISENSSVTLMGSFTDPGLPDTHTVGITWGDPNNATGSSFSLSATNVLTTGLTFNSTTGDGAVLTVGAIDSTTGLVNFTVASHSYLDDGVSGAQPGANGTAADISTITVTVTDDDLGVGVASKTVTVSNVAPTLSVSAPDILENGTTTLSGTLTDIGRLDTHDVVIDWDDANDTTARTSTCRRSSWSMSGRVC